MTDHTLIELARVQKQRDDLASSTARSRRSHVAKRCLHENADHLFPSDPLYICGRFAGLALVEQLRCIDCGAWLSLGPSRDDDERVKVEIRAARLVAGYETGHDTDDDLDDHVVLNIHAAWCGFRNMSIPGQEVVDLYNEIIAPHTEES